MVRHLIKAGSRFADIASFSRAVVDGDMLCLSGTTGHYHETGSFPDDAAEQAELAFHHIEATLARPEMKIEIEVTARRGSAG